MRPLPFQSMPLQCASIYGVCDQDAGCHSDGRCRACNLFPTSSYEDGLDPEYSSVLINGTCQSVPLGCLVSRTLPDGRCTRCQSPGYVLLQDGSCNEVRWSSTTQPCCALCALCCTVWLLDVAAARNRCFCLECHYAAACSGFVQGPPFVRALPHPHPNPPTHPPLHTHHHHHHTHPSAQCPTLCAKCTASRSCLRCRDGYSLQAGRCVKCSVPGCMRCMADPAVCEKCGDSYYSDGSLGLKDGKCVSCQDPHCSDCGANWAVCTSCAGPGQLLTPNNGTVLKDGKCVQVSRGTCAGLFLPSRADPCNVLASAWPAAGW